MNIICLYC